MTVSDSKSGLNARLSIILNHRHDMDIYLLFLYWPGISVLIPNSTSFSFKVV